ncbi:MAG: glycosyltransferase [Anaerolineales bacterium]|nr:glycosyltransferase [Anaerolineales bacterium]
MIENLLAGIYILVVAGLALYGLVGLLTLWLYWRHRHEDFICPVVADADLPLVTVQLPIYNERFVVGRLIETAVALDYPPDKLQIQVVDDSTDDTTEIARALVVDYQARGVNIQLLHRQNRQGYKAGALAASLDGATGEYLAIFDADFQPKPDFLRSTIPHFNVEDDLGMIQARWGHLNADATALTGAQAIALDKHFAMEQTVRHRAQLFPKFNGAAGVWRRRCLEDAGGWQADTVCEDLCLSTRAILRGWQFRFLNDVIAPAELPTSIMAYKNQQARWAKGSIQCLLKFTPEIMRDRQQSLLARLYAVISMSGYATHFLLILLLLLQIPMLWFDVHLTGFMLIFTLIGVGQPLLFVVAQQVLYNDWIYRLRHFPTLLLVAVGMAASNSRAMLEVGYGRSHVFVRTPKGFANRQKTKQKRQLPFYRLPFDRILLFELFFALYAAVGLILAVWRGNFGSLFLPVICLLGFGYVAYLGLREWRG